MITMMMMTTKIHDEDDGVDDEDDGYGNDGNSRESRNNHYTSQLF